MVGVENPKKYEVAQSIAEFLASDEELLRTFRNFSSVTFDPSPHGFYCGWVMSIMGTAFYSRWNQIRGKVARLHKLDSSEDWATISVLAHDLIKDVQDV
jgi:hypothetical protein